MINSARLFPRIDTGKRKTVAVAVSGGSDSIALLHLLQIHYSKTKPSIRLVALTVDHGLRPNSGEEADWVRAFCQARGIDHRTLRWEGEKPQTGLAAAARGARYQLLSDAARNAGTDMIFIGHTSDDQAETLLMRSSRGKPDLQNRGLAAMAPATLYDSRVWLLRPLLGVSRAVLRRHLTNQNIGWIDDPSNQIRRYERVRMRTVLEASDDPEELKNALVDRAGEAAVRRRALGEAAAGLIDRHASKCIAGLIRVDPLFFDAPVPDEDGLAARIYAAAALLAVTGGSAYLPNAARIAAVLEKLNSAGNRATLSGTVADRRRSGIFLYRETRRGGPGPVACADGIAWDRRYRILAGEIPLKSDRLVGAIGRKQAILLETDAGDWPQSLTRAARASLPALWQEGVCLGPIEIRENPETQDIAGSALSAVPISAPWLEFLPSFDLTLAASVARLIGQPKIDQIPI